MNDLIIQTLGILLFSQFVISGNIIQLDLDSNLLSIHTGENLIATIKVINLENDAPKDYLIRTSLVDSDGNTIYEKTQTVAIFTSTSITINIPTEPDMKDGTYNIIVKLEDIDDHDEIATTSETVTIENNQFFNRGVEQKKLSYLAIWILIGALIIFSIIVYFNHKKMKKELKAQRVKIDEIVNLQRSYQK